MWLPSSPFLPCVRSPGAPPAGACSARASYEHGRVIRPAPSLRCLPTLPLCPHGGGRCRPLPTFIPHPWGGGGVCGGGKPCRHLFVARMSQARRKHGAGMRRGTRPSARGGGDALWLPSSPFLPRVRTPGGPPAGACSARALYGHGRVVRPAPSGRCLPTLPLCPRGAGRFSPPPCLHPPPWGGAEVCVGGGGGALVVFPPQHARLGHDASMRQARGAALVPLQGGGGLPCVTRRRPSYPACAPPGGRRCVWEGGGLSSSLRCTHVAGTTQARRKHGVRHLAAAGGGGVSPLGLPALFHGIGSATQDLQPLLSLGGSRHVSAWPAWHAFLTHFLPIVVPETAHFQGILGFSMAQKSATAGSKRPKNTCLSIPSCLATTLEKNVFFARGTVVDPPLAPTQRGLASPPAAPSDHRYGGLCVSLGCSEAWKP